MTDKEFLYKVAKLVEKRVILDKPALEGTSRRLRRIARTLPLTQTTLKDEDIELARKTN